MMLYVLWIFAQDPNTYQFSIVERYTSERPDYETCLSLADALDQQRSADDMRWYVCLPQGTDLRDTTP